MDPQSIGDIMFPLSDSAVSDTFRVPDSVSPDCLD
jgi:hypothetical protein